MTGRIYQVSAGISEEEKPKVLKELRLGFLNLSEGMFAQARVNFLLALQYDSKCADAYWGLMLFKLGIKDEAELLKDPNSYKDTLKMTECQNAFAFGNETQRNIYEDLLEGVNALAMADSF